MDNSLQNTIGLPSTDSRTWNAEYGIGDVVRVRVDFIGGGISNDPQEIFNIDKDSRPYQLDSRGNNIGGFSRPENPTGKLYILANGQGWEGKDLEPIDIGQPTKASTTTAINTQTTTQSGISLYQSALLNALNVSPQVQATLPQELLDSAYVIYEIQKLYASTPEGQQKNQLALAISEGARILLSEINNISINKPIYSVTTKKGYEVGDMFRVKDDTDERP